ncbi:MAG: ABC transporter permease, partial [Planctomycetes bacterium]|nr:ABC transporter permease [Planctomycetota bacterium]
MFALHRTLSLRYFSRRWFRALLIVASIMLGVATLVATRSLSETMNKALLAGANPMAGTIDLIVTNGDLNVDRDLIDDIRKIPAVKSANPRIFDQAKIVVGDKKLPVMVMGVDLSNDMKDFEEIQEHFEYSKTALVDYGLARQKDKIPVILGKDLDDELKNHKDQLEVFKIDLFVVKTELTLLSLEKGLDQQHKVARVGWMALKDDAKERDKYAAFAGHVVIMDLPHAATVVGLRPVDTRNVKLDLLAPPGGMAWGLLASSLADRRWKVRRIDIALTPGTDLKTARKKIEAVLSGRGVIRTMEEQNQSLQSATVGMQTAFSMCGVAALIVGMFLVYNSLSVSVAERRHEIGILLALGATRDQVWRLFAGEAFVMGAVGAALGLPLGIGLANLGLEPMQEAIGDVFTSMNARQVELNWEIVAQAFAVGILSAVVASMVPAVQAAYDNPAEAVRRVPKDPPITYLVLHILTTVLLIGGGMSMILMRDVIPRRWGTYGGLGLVMIGTLLAAPLIAQVLARMLIPVSRRFFSIEWRLAADNLVRAPGRTGMVIGALAAGVCLIVETAGIIRSNRQAIMEWVDSPTTSDIMVTSGSPIGSSGQSNLMEENIGDELGGIPGVELALP